MEDGKILHLTIEGRQIEAEANCSILQAFLHAGQTLTEGVGCMGQGVCGSCRVMVRRSDDQDVKTALACETLIEEGMQVAFLDYFTESSRQTYRLEDIRDSWQLLRTISEVFSGSVPLPPLQRLRSRLSEGPRCPKRRELRRGGQADRVEPGLR